MTATTVRGEEKWLKRRKNILLNSENGWNF